MRFLFEWWGGQSPWIRFGVAGIFLLISTVLFFMGSFWPWGWAVGAVLLVFSFPNNAQKRGYHDF